MLNPVLNVHFVNSPFAPLSPHFNGGCVTHSKYTISPRCVWNYVSKMLLTFNELKTWFTDIKCFMSRHLFWKLYDNGRLKLKNDPKRVRMPCSCCYNPCLLIMTVQHVVHSK